MQIKQSLLTATVLLASRAFGCVVYTAQAKHATGFLQAELYDNSNSPTCWFNGYIGGDGLYRFTCIAANFAAIASGNGQIVEYSNPGGDFRFSAQAYNNEEYATCVYGCSASQCPIG